MTTFSLSAVTRGKLILCWARFGWARFGSARLGAARFAVSARLSSALLGSRCRPNYDFKLAKTMGNTLNVCFNNTLLGERNNNA